MADLIIYVFLYILSIGALVFGIIAIGYGLYAMTIPGFDKSIVNVSLIAGTLLVSIVLSFYFGSPFKEKKNEINKELEMK